MQYLIKAASKTTIVFIDYATNLSIVNQIKLTSSSTNKLNLRLVRVFIYLFQFQLDIKYRSNKIHTISDILSRLSASSKEDNQNLKQSNILNLNIFYRKIRVSIVLNLDIYYSSIANSKISNQVYIYQSIIIAILTDFQENLIAKYQKKTL